jgi:hypothetical protein
MITQNSERNSREFEFRLPPNAKQGGGEWYLVRLHYELVIAKDSGPGTIYLWASTNGRGAASIEIEVQRRNGEIRVKGNDLGMVTGSRRWTQRGLVRESTFENYLQYSGVKGGKNTLSFAFIVLGKARFERWRIFEDSGVVRAHSGPAKIELTPFITDRDIVPGERFSIRYEIRNTSRMPLPPGGRVSIVTPSNNALRVIGTSSRHVEGIPGLAKAVGSFELKAKCAGSIPVTLESSSWGGSPSVRLAVKVRKRSTSGRAGAGDRNCAPASVRPPSVSGGGDSSSTDVKLTADQKSRAIALAQSNEQIREALGDRRTRVTQVAPWSSEGGVFGADLTLKLDQQATLEADWTTLDFAPADGSNYRQETPVRYRADRVTELEVYVDLEKDEVVAFSPLDGDVVTSSIQRVGASHRSDSSGMPVWEMILLGLGSAAVLSLVAWFARRVVVSRGAS